MLSLLANLKPEGETDIAHSLVQVAAMLRHASLVMIFSDLLAEPGPVLEALYRLRHGGHDVIVFHVLDEAEVDFPFKGMVELEEPESHQRLALDADAFRHAYLSEVESFRNTYRRECFQAGVDYVPLGYEHEIRSGAGGIPDAEKRARISSFNRDPAGERSRAMRSPRVAVKQLHDP